MIVVNRETKKEMVYQYGYFVSFLYNKLLGRLFLKLLCNSVVANIVALYMNSSLSKAYMNRKIRQYNVDMNLYESDNYANYNKFFIRKLKNIEVNKNRDVFISPSDSKLMILKMDHEMVFNIKNSLYSAREIINDDIIDDYENGYALIFRLDVGDYHRYCFIDSGMRSDYKHIKGKLHTVMPIAYSKYKVFHQNSREWTILKTDNYGDVIQVEIGAMMIGRICNHNQSNHFSKGEEKGYFEFGGSTIILFVKNNVIDFDDDIIKNSSNYKETIVKYGERIGKKKNSN